MLKKTIYIVSTILLLGVSSLVLYLYTMVSYGEMLALKLSILFLCIVGGYGLGQHRWRIVYIEKRHRSMRSSGIKKSMKSQQKKLNK